MFWLLLHFSVIFLSTKTLIFEFYFHSLHLILIYQHHIIILFPSDLSFLKHSLNFFSCFDTLFASELSYKHVISQNFYSNLYLSLIFLICLTFSNLIFSISLSILLCSHHEESLELGALYLINYL